MLLIYPHRPPSAAITGKNFGVYNSAPGAGMCVMLAWANRPADSTPVCCPAGSIAPACLGVPSGPAEPFPGAFGVVFPAPGAWTDTAITIPVPAGIGARDVLVSAALQVGDGNAFRGVPAFISSCALV